MAKKTASQTKAAKTAAISSGVEAMFDAHPNLKNTVAQIEKQFGEGAIMPLGAGATVAIDGIPTGSLSLDMALGGQGIPAGRIVEIFGPESSGKTTLALHVVAQAQRRGGIAAFIDAEHALDPSLGQEAGRRTGNAAGQPAQQRRRGHAHHRDADQVERGRRDRDRLGGRPGAPRRNWKARSAIRTSACRPG